MELWFRFGRDVTAHPPLLNGTTHGYFVHSAEIIWATGDFLITLSCNLCLKQGKFALFFIDRLVKLNIQYIHGNVLFL